MSGRTRAGGGRLARVRGEQRPLVYSTLTSYSSRPLTSSLPGFRYHFTTTSRRGPHPQQHAARNLLLPSM